jgi:hypothetical protein
MAGLDDRDVVYVAGSEYDPGDSRGKDLLVIRADDTFRMDNRFRGAARAWTGSLADGSFAALVRLLEEAGFPDVPRHPVPGGSAIRELHHAGGTAMVAWHAAKDLPGWAEVFADLDAIVNAVHAGEATGRVASVAGATGDR